MEKERITILNDKNQKLAVYFFKNPSSKRLLLMCSGWATFDEIPKMNEVFNIYFSLGNSVCYFDYTGFGKSEGKTEINLEQRVNDIEKVIQYFSQEYKEIILYTPSFAAIPGSIASTKHKNVKKLVILNGFFYLNKYVTVYQFLRLNLYLLLHPNAKRQLEFAEKNFNPEIIKVPTLIIYGEKDKVVNPKQSLYVFEHLKTKKELVKVPNGDHALMKDEYLLLPQLKRLFAWLS